MKVVGNDNANKLLEWSIQSDDLIDADADEYVVVFIWFSLLCCDVIHNIIIIIIIRQFVRRHNMSVKSLQGCRTENTLLVLSYTM